MDMKNVGYGVNSVEMCSEDAFHSCIDETDHAYQTAGIKSEPAK